MDRVMASNSPGMVRSANDDGVPRKLPWEDRKEDRRRKLLQLKNQEYQEYQEFLLAKEEARRGKIDKGTLAREGSIMEQTEPMSPRSLVSVSTQTEAPGSAPAFTLLDTPTSHLPAIHSTKTRIWRDSEPSPEEESPSKLFPIHKEAFITSPRAKLIKDLHGVSPCLPGASPLLTLPDQGASDEKLKQMLYAEALKAQIDEKKKIEEEKRKKEMEQEEMLERKAKEQQERLKLEYEREQSRRQDELMQKQAQEESLRQRLLEMELEAKSLKRREREGKRRLSGDVDGWSGPHTLPPTRPHHLPLSTDYLSNMDLNEFLDAEGRMSPQLKSGLAQAETLPESVRLDSNSTPKNPQRPPSPVLPALHTEALLRKSNQNSPRGEHIQLDEREELLRGDKIWTQLGLFRRELELEQERLQQKLQQQAQQS